MTNEIETTGIEEAAFVPSVPEKKEPTALDLATLMKQHGTKSNVIRYLAGIGMKRARIADFMDIRYQFVRNVLTAPVGKKKDLI